MHEVLWGVIKGIAMRDRGEPKRAEGESIHGAVATEASTTDPKGSLEVGSPSEMFQI